MGKRRKIAFRSGRRPVLMVRLRIRGRMIPNEPTITPELVAEHGLKPDEYERILQLIGREPTITELGIFSAMWNEHCSYKSSKIHLRTLPTSGAYVIQGPGENAGVISIGDG